jgi:hypothetical protein
LDLLDAACGYVDSEFLSVTLCLPFRVSSATARPQIMFGKTVGWHIGVKGDRYARSELSDQEVASSTKSQTTHDNIRSL